MRLVNREAMSVVSNNLNTLVTKVRMREALLLVDHIDNKDHRPNRLRARTICREPIGDEIPKGEDLAREEKSEEKREEDADMGGDHPRDQGLDLTKEDEGVDLLLPDPTTEDVMKDTQEGAQAEIVAAEALTRAIEGSVTTTEEKIEIATKSNATR
jgi:hypothetical protein